MSRRTSGLLLAGALLLGLTACSGSSGSSSGLAASQVGGGRADGAVAPGLPQKAPEQQQNASGQQQNATSAPVQNRQLVQTARIEMSVDGDPMGAIVSARGIAVSLSGFTGQEESGGDKATITLRVPADKFDSALDQIGKLGTVKSQHKQADDVTDQVVDLDARLATQRASVDRMRALLAKAGSVSEVAQVESELTRREADLESMESRRTTLGGQVALSTVVLEVTKNAPPPPKPIEEKSDTGFLSGLSGGWDAFVKVVTGLGTALGAMLPFLIALAIPGGAYLYIRRRRRKPTPTPTPATEPM